jgi:hypothetical protein
MTLLAWRLDVHVYLLSSATSEQSSSKHEQHYKNHDYEDREYGNNSCASATSSFTFFGHEAVPPFVFSCEQGANEEGGWEIVNTLTEVGQTYLRFKI